MVMADLRGWRGVVAVTVGHTKATVTRGVNGIACNRYRGMHRFDYTVARWG